MPGPAELSLLRSATLADGSRVDVELAGGRVTAVVPAGTAGPAAAELDLDGYLLLPAAADPHAHLDKARSWDAIRPPMGDLGTAIAAWRAYAATMTEDDVAERARTQALAMLAAGTTAIRSHVDIRTGDDPTLGTRALVRVRDELAPLLDLELVALAGPETTDRAVEEALDLGVDLVGGACHLAEDPHDDMARLLAIAERRGVGVDLHVDESLDGPVTLDAFARAVRGWTTNVSAGHCCRLGTLPPAERDRVIAEVRASDVGVIANPITNLYLQGWQHPTSTPRGLAPARELLDAGVRFAAGADNVRDPFNPLGRGDALETAALLVVAGHLTVAEAYAAVSSGAREVLRLPVAGPVVGGVADLLAVRGADLAAVVADAPADRVVLRGGRVVARTTTTTEVALPWSAPAPAVEPRAVAPLAPVPPALSLEASR
ncbi:amidohydrolase family protein [Microlunatus capsulatus]|uniref:Cytosine deaminase n=1 Tax=Microlunatus capsulatus TaxID=99117 RepID=A0ABS4Z707_9ACTN|nr:amidohydrolase family protein [Microlunatus capsulatus]MBP2416836.1 cytosine deaminase [Microlunatus capsulatus]